MTDKISLDKKYRTRAGDEAEVFATDMNDMQPVMGRFRCENGGWRIGTWSADGKYNVAGFETEFDLIEVKPPVWAWVNVYSSGLAASFFDTRKQADALAGANRTGCIRLNLTELQGRFDDEATP